MQKIKTIMNKTAFFLGACATHCVLEALLLSSVGILAIPGGIEPGSCRTPNQHVRHSRISIYHLTTEEL